MNAALELSDTHMSIDNDDVLSTEPQVEESCPPRSLPSSPHHNMPVPKASTVCLSPALLAKLDPASSEAMARPRCMDDDMQTLCEEVEKTKNRCHSCNKKVGLLGFVCRCEGTFCSKHRHADEHKCMFDFKLFEREKLRRDNPTITAEKLNKI